LLSLFESLLFKLSLLPSRLQRDPSSSARGTRGLFEGTDYSLGPTLERGMFNPKQLYNDGTVALVERGALPFYAVALNYEYPWEAC